jgi:hypothetical protein
MRFPFRDLPAASAGLSTPRPVVPISLENLTYAPVDFLIDTGALRTRISADLAAFAGVDLSGALTEEFYVAGLRTAGSLARVHLTVTDGIDESNWDAPVWFCDPWPHPFGLAGLEGFFYHHLVMINAYDGYLDVEPRQD